MIKRSIINLTATSILLAGLVVVATAAELKHVQGGIASVYSGGRTANGERASPRQLTAAHRSLPYTPWSGSPVGQPVDRSSSESTIAGLMFAAA